MMRAFARPAPAPETAADFEIYPGAGAPYVDPNLSRMRRMTDPASLGPGFFTADQEDQRHYLGAGYDGDLSHDATSYPADPTRRDANGNSPAMANCARLTRHPGGVADCVRLEATADGWIAPPSRAPRDFKVVNW
jgi:hypothetical protein